MLQAKCQTHIFGFLFSCRSWPSNSTFSFYLFDTLKSMIFIFCPDILVSSARKLTQITQCTTHLWKEVLRSSLYLCLLDFSIFLFFLFLLSSFISSASSFKLLFVSFFLFVPIFFSFSGSLSSSPFPAF